MDQQAAISCQDVRENPKELTLLISYKERLIVLSSWQPLSDHCERLVLPQGKQSTVHFSYGTKNGIKDQSEATFTNYSA